MIKEITNLFKNYAENHKVIKSFSFGDSFNIEKTGEDIYTHMFLQYPFQVTGAGATKDVTFTYYIIEQPKVDSHDDMETINLLDKCETLNTVLLVKLGLKDYTEFNSLVNYNTVTFTEGFGDNTVGVITDITLRIQVDINSCFDPITNAE